MEGLRAAIKYFRPYILDRNLVLRVDHRPIVELSRSKLLNARLFRIYDLLRTYDIVVEYIPGRLNLVSDTLSRLTEPADGVMSTDPLTLPEGLVEIEIPGGGDSLVRAFAHTYLGDEGRHSEVRGKAVRALRANPARFKLFEADEVSKATK